MKLLQCIFVLFFFLFVSGNLSIQAQTIAVDAKRLVNTEKADLTIKLINPHLTSLRIVNVLSPDDTYAPINILNEQVYVFFLVKLKNGRNVFYVDAYTQDDRIDGLKIEIQRIDAPNAVAENASQRSPDPAQQTSGGDAPPKPVKNTEPPAKLKLQAQTNVIDRSTDTITVDRSNLDSQFGKYVIEVKNGGRTETKEVSMEVDKADVGKIKSPQEIPVGLFEGKNTVTIYPKVNNNNLTDSGNKIDITCTNCIDSFQSTSTRAVIGYEQVGASSTSSTQHPFLDFYFDTPLGITLGRTKIPCPPTCDPVESTDAHPCAPTCDPNSKTKTIKKKTFDFSLWANLRFSSIPVQTLVSFSNLSTFSGFLEDKDQKSNELAQSFDFLVGLEKKLPFHGFFGPGFFRGRGSVYLIAAGGAINPIAPDKTAQIFKIPLVGTDVDPKFLELIPEAKGKKNIAFVSPERDHFFRQYFGGFRVKTNFYDSDNKPLNIFPAMFDFMVGQNEAITGSLKGVIMKFDGSSPLPIKGTDYLFIYGSAQLRLGRKVTTGLPSFFLQPGDSTATLTSTDTVVVPVDRYPQTISNRDIFRIGIGVDIFKLFNQSKDKDK
jgi:hypothetical protein